MPVKRVITSRNPAPEGLTALAAGLALHGGGRSLEELKESDEILKGVESQRLRNFCTSQVMNPNTDLDDFGTMVFWGRVDEVKDDIQRRLKKYESLPQHTRLERVAEEIYNQRYGPNRTPIMNCIGQARILLPRLQDAHLEIARYILDTLAPVVNKRVNIVDTPDLAGTTALGYAISTKPAFDPEFAQVLWEAGANINHRNRYGATAAHELCMVWQPYDSDVINRAQEALVWFLGHGGNPEQADADGMKPSDMAMRIQRGLETILKEHEAKRRQREREPTHACVICGERDRKLKVCSQCESTRYCAPPRRCQMADWPVHKLTCKRPPSSAKRSQEAAGSFGQ